MGDWTSNTNEALSLCLVRSKEDTELLADDEKPQVFHPTFTYPIFGDEEKVYGYNNLSIKLRYASGSLAQYLSITYSSKLSGPTVDDIEGTLYKFIPPDYYKNEEDFLARVEKDATTFKPMGTKIDSYTRRAAGKGKGKTKASNAIAEDDEDAVVYEVYHTTWETPGFREYHRKMQLFILLYIEGGSYIQEDEDEWEFVVLYERRRRKDGTLTYHFVGYSSLYRFYYWPEKTRMRLSQFVIIPPYQKAGHGSALYNSIYKHVLASPQFAELTVEDPSEAFEDLRDKNDLRMLLAHPTYLTEGYGPAKGKGKLGPPVDKQWAEQWRLNLKLAGRQYNRLVEMLILRTLEPNDVRGMRAFRLQVKERLFRFNYEILAQLEKADRLEKLEETFQNVIEDYSRILAFVE